MSLFNEDAEEKIKKLMTDEQQIEQLDREEQSRLMEEAVGMFLTAEREHQRLSARHDVVSDPKINLLWWESLERTCAREKVVWKLFCGGKPSPEQNALYCRFRYILLKGNKLIVNA